MLTFGAVASSIARPRAAARSKFGRSLALATFAALAALPLACSDSPTPDSVVSAAATPEPTATTAPAVPPAVC